MYSDPPLFCKLAHVTGERRWFEEAAAYALNFWDVLVDARVPLLYHGYDDVSAKHIGLLWGRGVGWALLGLVDTLTEMPEDINGRNALLANFRSMAEAMRDLQADNGHWHTVLDHRETYLENSIACFVCAAYYKAMRTGLLDSSFEECTQRSWAACTGVITEAGQILVSEATPEGDVALYQKLGLGIYPWGQGSALRAIDEQLRSETENGER